MIESYLELRPMFARHETFHPRYGWLFKAANAVAANETVFSAEHATVELGVGKNMVRAIRYWGRAFDVLEEAEHPHRARLSADAVTDFGSTMFGPKGFDPYLERPASLWLLHWQLLRPPCLAPVWSIAFNTYAPVQFDEADLVAFAEDVLARVPGSTEVASSSIKKDVDCLIRMYAPGGRSRDSLEDQLDCPFRELALLEGTATAGRNYRFNFGPKPTLPDAVIAYAALDFAQFSGVAAQTVSVSRLASAQGGPGRVFKMPESAIGDALERFASCAGAPISITARGGLRQLAFDGDASELVAKVRAMCFQRPARKSSSAGDLRDSVPAPRRPNGSVTMKLSSRITPATHFARSVNLERDSVTTAVDGYLPTARALETLRRFAAALMDPSRTRAWSVTGPYGAGKSSFALFLDGLCSAPDSPEHVAARRRLLMVDPAIADEMTRATAQAGAGQNGFVRAVAVAQREPATVTLTRAIRGGLDRHPGRGAALVRARRVLQSLEGSEITARKVAEAASVASEVAPVLLVIDEFGKNLEHFADSRAEADLFVLQEIAERASADAGSPIFLFTLQHLAFDEYLSGASSMQRREWAKVQGRFEDIAFTDSTLEMVRLISQAFERKAGGELGPDVASWADKHAAVCRQLGLGELLPREVIDACYPLHPTTVLCAPELCSRYGQRERTLFSFLTRAEPRSVVEFLEATPADTRPLPSVAPSQLYDYLVESAGTLLGTGANASRFFEIHTRLRDAHRLDERSLSCLKTIAVLNLISQGGALRASRELLTYVLDASEPDVERLLTTLVEKGFLSYREFADEYRIWQGTDFDLGSQVDDTRRRLVGEGIAALCERSVPLTPVVAARHSQEVGILRVFARHYVDATTCLDDIVAPDQEADGHLLYILDPTVKPAKLDVSVPVVWITSTKIDELTNAALEAAATRDVLTTVVGLQDDWVARSELTERAAIAVERFYRAVEEVFALDDPDVEVFEGGTRVRAQAKTLSGVLSNACDHAYPDCPVIRNEMVARRQLSSQGAKAARELIVAMIEHADVECLELEGYGPERAIYEAILAHPGIHRLRPDGSATFSAPKESSGYRPAWQAIIDNFDAARLKRVSISTIYERLLRPPFGLKEGPIPILLTAALILNSDDIAIYQDGTYQPILTADLVERLVKSPERFTIKNFGLTGARQAVLNTLTDVLDLPLSTAVGRRRNPGVVSVVAPLVATLRGFPEFARRTQGVSHVAQGVRAAINDATEPDRLVFIDLPEAVGCRPFGAGERGGGDRALEYADRLLEALRELQQAYPALLQALREQLRVELQVPGATDVRTDIAARSRRLLDGVIHHAVKSFLLASADTQLDDDDWVENLAMNVVDKPPSAWLDAHATEFRHALREIAAAVHRLEAVHFANVDARREGFEARRVIVTAPDGDEASGVVWLNQGDIERLDPVLATAVAAAEAEVGDKGATALLALLAARQLRSVHRAPQQVTYPAGTNSEVG